MTTRVSFDALVQNADINVRTSGKRQDIEALAASILANGVLQPLAVRRHPDNEDLVEIVDGDRRYAAIKLLIDRGAFDPDVQVPVHYTSVEFLSKELAREASLAANIERVPLHPIDEFEAFSDLAKTMKPTEIADRFGVSEKQVRQRIALGALHPDIRAAWRAGEIRDDVARAFTVTDDQKRQLKVFNALKKKQSLWGDKVRIALGVNQDASKAIRLIGADAYRAAGGQITQDLFGDGCVVSDPKLAQTLAADFLKNECDRLIADGWSFAILAEEVKDRWNWPILNPSGKREPTPEEEAELAALSSEKQAIEAAVESDDGLDDARERRLEEIDARIEHIEQEIELRRWGARQKSKAGCFVGVSYRGDLEITYGVQNQKDAKKKDKPKQQAGDDDHHDDGDVDGEKPAISNALTLALSEQLTIASAKALSADPLLALRATVAALEQWSPSCPVNLRGGGYPAMRAQLVGDIEHVGFEDALHDLLTSSDEAVLGRLAVAVSKTLDMRRMNGGEASPATRALIGALDARDFTAAAREVFDAGAYFKAVNIAICNAALDEMGIEVKGRPKKKSDLATMCADAARERGWLPPELRHPSTTETEELRAAE